MTTTCPAPRELLAFWDGELEGEELDRMERHLHECEDCREALRRDKRKRLSHRQEALVRLYDQREVMQKGGWFEDCIREFAHWRLNG